MPKAYDSRHTRLIVTHDPTQRIDFEAPNLKGNKFSLTETLQALVDALVDIVGMSLAGLGDVISSIFEAILGAAAAFWELLLKLPLIGDLIEVVTGVEDGNPNDLGSWANGVLSDLRTMVDNLVSGLFGWAGHSWTNDDARQAIRDAATTISGLSTAVTALQSNRNNVAIGGVAATINFTTRPASSTLGSDFSHLRSGGQGHYSIVDNVGARWDPVNDGDATDAFTYADLATASDYQKVWVTFGSAPMWRSSQVKARNEIHGRKTATGDTYVFAGLEKYRADLGCVVSGARTVFATKTSFSFKATALYALECGTIGGLRIFRLLEGNTPVLQHTEVGTTSQVGPDNRHVGGQGQARASWLGTTPPGVMWALALADNHPPAVVGSGAMMFRTAAGDFSLFSGIGYVPTDFWNNLGANTPDITCSLSAGTFTVSRPDWYQVTGRLRLGTSQPYHVELFASINRGAPVGDRKIYLGADTVTGNAAGNAYAANAAFGSAPVYLDAGETVELGIESSSTAGSYSGEQTGTKTYFTIAAIGAPNLPKDGT